MERTMILNNLERGRGQVSLETAVALAKALDVPVQDLYEDLHRPRGAK